MASIQNARPENLNYDVIVNSENKEKTVSFGEPNSLQGQDGLDVLEVANNLAAEFEQIAKPQICTNIVDKLLILDFNLDNYEDFFGLNKYNAHNLSTSFQDKMHNIAYRDADGNTMCIVKIDFKHNKLILDFLANILPKQKYISPNEVFDKVHSVACLENWLKEDGGVNQFNGNLEFRYKDFYDNVMAAIIYNCMGNVENIVRYEYKNGKKSQMVNTGLFGETITIYDTSKEISHLMSVDIDTDGNILRVTKDFGS